MWFQLGWSFEETLSAFGCEIHAYDPTDGGKTQNISFNLHNHNISTKDDPNSGMFKLTTLLTKNHHLNMKISVLSLNLYGAEMEILPAILDDGGLENVDHLVVNFYAKPGKRAILNQTFQTLYTNIYFPTCRFGKYEEIV